MSGHRLSQGARADVASKTVDHAPPKCESTHRLQKLLGVTLVSGIFFFAVVSCAWATARNNGAAGYQDQSLVFTPINVPIGNVLIVPTAQYHSSIIAQGLRRITDTDFANLVFDNFVLAQAAFPSLNIHMGQCFGGGFIDELDHGTADLPGGMSNFTINSAAAWSRLSNGQETASKQRNLYSNAWWVQVDASINNKQMLNAYTAALTFPLFLAPERAKQMPQYFSRPDARDAAFLNSAPGTKIALLFVGDDRVNVAGMIRRGQSMYRDALRMYGTLINLYGYAPNNVKVYYHDGTAPPGAPMGLPIDGPATVANFESFFLAPPQVIKGEDDGIFIWISDHGGLQLQFTGQVGLVANPVGMAAQAQVDFSPDQQFLDAVASTEFAKDFLGLPYLQLDSVLNSGGEPISVFLNGSPLGTVTNPTDRLEFDPGLLTSTNSIRFEAPSFSVVIGDFSLNIQAAMRESLICDVDGNEVVDRNDINAIFAARGTAAVADDPRDADGDGMVTVNDARICTLLCANTNCAP